MHMTKLLASGCVRVTLPRFISAMTLVVRRRPKGPRVIDEHVWMKTPPKAIDYSKLRAE